MDSIAHELENELELLDNIIKQKKAALLTAPEGRLRISKSYKNARPCYYHCTDNSSVNGKYMKNEDMPLIKALAQKGYNKKVLRASIKRKADIEELLTRLSDSDLESLYYSLSEERKALVRPVQQTDEQYQQEWEAVPYTPKAFRSTDPVFYTLRGERVRSKSEIIIADIISSMNIPYRYEAPLFLEGLGTIYPDFTLLNVRKRQEIYLEHFGMMDNVDYCNSAIKRIAAYEVSGIVPGQQLLFTFETSLQPIDQKALRKILAVSFYQ